MSVREELHAQQAFGKWVEAGMPLPPATPDFNILAVSEEIMPDALCDRLKLQRGSMYQTGNRNARMAISMRGNPTPEGLPGSVQDWLWQLRRDRDATLVERADEAMKSAARFYNVLAQIADVARREATTAEQRLKQITTLADDALTDRGEA